ncbi:unnamed protein product [Agarophyton chilense]|eukprot:gb/GEZJ01003568.1/.p1 GENE.gb/GEZJ01003568.1/~~gb/GEZJ01003568.1/.p1  ORF type:complete len:687 (+),score=106.60 gb/GEZJ01003568.1/:52-2061(+)
MRLAHRLIVVAAAAAALCGCVAHTSAAHTSAASHALRRNAFRATFPIEIMLKDSETGVLLHRPVGIVAGLDTTMYVASVSGQIMLVDVKTGAATLLNRGGDDQPFGGLCLDSRGPGTLYATGRNTGAVFAFNRRGELLQRYQLTTVREKGGTAFLTGCIQTRYQLIVIDSNNARFHYLPLADEGPLRGYPPLLTDTVFQGERLLYEGDAYIHKNTIINAYGVEWTQKFNRSAYVLNSATGHIFTVTLNESTVIPLMRKVTIMGRVDTFVGAMAILFDSTNENIMYISMPHLNAIAVLEFSRTDSRKAKFIRYLKSALTNGPVAMGEFGNWLFPISGDFDRRSPNTPFSIVQIPRHEQIIETGDSSDEYTTVLDDVEQTSLPVVFDTAEVQQEIRTEPDPVGTSAPEPILPQISQPLDESTSPGHSTAPADATTDSPAVDDDSARETPAAATPVSADATVTPSDPEQPDREPSTFGAAAEESASATPSQRACFPADATVTLRDGSSSRMDRLRIGDRVHVATDEEGDPVFSEVFMFSHQHPHIVSSFVSIEASHGDNLHVSPGHYLYVNDKLLSAAHVRPRDVLQSQANRSILALRVSSTQRRGLYNPQTVHGDIVVNGVRVSTYTTAVQPVTAQALMAPVRALYSCRTRWPQRISALLSSGIGRSQPVL